MNIKMTSVFVNDPIAAFKFYTEKLGFKELMYMPEMKLAIVVSPEQPKGTSLLLEPNEVQWARDYQETAYKAGLPVIIFGVIDVRAEYKKLIERGVKFRSAPTKNEWGTQAVFDDTCGNYIQIHQDP